VIHKTKNFVNYSLAAYISRLVGVDLGQEQLQILNDSGYISGECL
jgi:hypothetical protein